ncbi:MAG: MerR family transcriptional regulator, heat shock protein HspR [Thermoleophilaceae bacterium]|nr:MerR family transcriptional regulator, heat shock protein HspR [Thermoleophilaceae bacterium]MEA2368107.1 MerR family transcriptional regulator, heat shock protein HspR [Thermoleophilaceae bacterium]
MAGDGNRRGARSPRGSAPSPRRGVYMISVAAELAGMHPQTLRIYESRGLIEPRRSAGNTRLYSQQDVDRLRRIQELTNEMGMNLAGVEKVFELESELDRMRSRMETLRRQAERAERELRDEIERIKRSFRAELVPYQPPGSALIPARDARGPRVVIPISRRPSQGGGTTPA